MRKVLITGAAGCLGSYLRRQAPTDAEVHALWRNTRPECEHAHQLDLGDRDAVLELVQHIQPQTIIHTAYSSTDLENDVLAATRNLTDACIGTDIHFINMSSDLVFDGESPFYGESSKPNPILEYGRAKADMEEYVAHSLDCATTIRTSLIVGLEPLNPSSAWIIHNLEQGKPVSLFVDELRCPIGAEDLAAQIWEIASLGREKTSGMWHLVGPEILSRYSIGLLLAQRYGLDSSLLNPTLNAELTTPRPRDLRLSTARADRELTTKARPLAELLLSPNL